MTTRSLADAGHYLHDAYDGAMQTPDLNERPREDDGQYGAHEAPFSLRQQLPEDVPMEHVNLSLQSHVGQGQAASLPASLLSAELQPPLPHVM